MRVVVVLPAGSACAENQCLLGLEGEPCLNGSPNGQKKDTCIMQDGNPVDAHCPFSTCRCDCAPGYTGTWCSIAVSCPDGSDGVVPGVLPNVSLCPFPPHCVRSALVSPCLTPFSFISPRCMLSCAGVHGRGKLSNCSVRAGFNGEVRAAVEPPYYVVIVDGAEADALQPVDCPTGADGTVPSGCMVLAGYKGKVVATTDFPLYYRVEGGASAIALEAVPCPVGSTGLVPSGCDVLPGYRGVVVASTIAPRYYSITLQPPGETSADALLPVQCPAGSSGLVPGTTGAGGASECNADAGYVGHVIATTVPPLFYTATLAEAPCPENTQGSTIPGGCPCTEGYEGTIQPSTQGPLFYTGNCTACRRGRFRVAGAAVWCKSCLDEDGGLWYQNEWGQTKCKECRCCGNHCNDAGVHGMFLRGCPGNGAGYETGADPEGICVTCPLGKHVSTAHASGGCIVCDACGQLAPSTPILPAATAITEAMATTVATISRPTLIYLRCSSPASPHISGIGTVRSGCFGSSEGICDSCAAGRYKQYGVDDGPAHSHWNTTCALCPRGYFSEAVPGGVQNCEECPDGRYGNQPGENCTLCSPGTRASEHAVRRLGSREASV